MRARIFCLLTQGPRREVLLLCFALILSSSIPAGPSRAQQNKTNRPQQLDKGITWKRDMATGELRIAAAPNSENETPDGLRLGPNVLAVRTEMVPVTCTVSTEDGTPVPGLERKDFQVFEDGVEQPISYFDASTQPASVALVIDASPSVLPDAQQMKQAADALIDALAPLDQAAVVDFSAHTYLQLPFSDVREQIRRAVARVDVRELLGDTGGSNIYQSVYLAASELFPGRTGRKAIVLLTDGQDSGLGLTLDFASSVPQPGRPSDRLTFDDVARLLAAQDIQIFAVSTENRPKVMTPQWLAAHQEATLVTPAARTSGIPPYTLYMAELVRRAGGQIYFLREAETMADTFHKIAQRIRAEYTLGFAPAPGYDGPATHTGWHALRVEVPGQPGVRIAHRAAYYVPAAQ
jgi:Ca-activated chloride channel homolog